MTPEQEFRAKVSDATKRMAKIMGAEFVEKVTTPIPQAYEKIKNSCL